MRLSLVWSDANVDKAQTRRKHKIQYNCIGRSRARTKLESEIEAPM